MKTICNLLSKLFFGLVVIPPAYLIYRFVAWSMRQDYDKTEEASDTDAP